MMRQMIPYNSSKEYFQPIPFSLKNQKKEKPIQLVDIFTHDSYKAKYGTFEVYQHNYDKQAGILLKYQYKNTLLYTINELKKFQDENGQSSYRQDLGKYFERVKNEDKFRQIFDPNRESYHRLREGEHNKPIHDWVQDKQNKLNSFAYENKKVDEWGFPYDKSDDLCLTLPAVFKFDKLSQSYQLEGKLTNQFAGFAGLDNLGKQISNLVTSFSTSLKEAHRLFKSATYSNQLVEDTKQQVSFQKEIRAFVQIFEMNLDAQQQYNGRFHKEGLSDESVLYSCLYVIQQDRGLDSGTITMSRNLDDGELKALGNSTKKISNKKKSEQINLGSIGLQEDLMIIFPNRNQHFVKLENNTFEAQKRLVIQLSVVNHINQPFTINDLELNYKFNDPLNDIAYQNKTKQSTNNYEVVSGIIQHNYRVN